MELYCIQRSFNSCNIDTMYPHNLILEGGFQINIYILHLLWGTGSGDKVFVRGTNERMEVKYSDADYAGDLGNPISTSWAIFFACGGAVKWLIEMFKRHANHNCYLNSRCHFDGCWISHWEAMCLRPFLQELDCAPWSVKCIMTIKDVFRMWSIPYVERMPTTLPCNFSFRGGG